MRISNADDLVEDNMVRPLIFARNPAIFLPPFVAAINAIARMGRFDDQR